MIIPTVTTTESRKALDDQGFEEELPFTTVSTFNRIHENGRCVVVAHDGQPLSFEDDCGIESVMRREAETFAAMCRDSGHYDDVTLDFIDTQAP